MNISILNALWSLLVGEKLDLEDPKLVTIVEMFDELFKDQSTIAMAVLSFLPHPSLAKLPILRNLTSMEKNFKTLGATQEFIEPYITEHKRTLDPENIRDFVDLMLLEIENTTDKESSFYGETGTHLHDSYFICKNVETSLNFFFLKSTLLNSCVEVSIGLFLCFFMPFWYSGVYF